MIAGGRPRNFFGIGLLRIVDSRAYQYLMQRSVRISCAVWPALSLLTASHSVSETRVRCKSLCTRLKSYTFTSEQYYEFLRMEIDKRQLVAVALALESS